MLEAVEQFLSIATIVFCLVVAFLVLIQRRIAETAFPKIKRNKYWRGLFLPLGPAATGFLLSWLVTSYPYPELFANSSVARAFFGITCGLASGVVYRIFKQFFGDKLTTLTSNIKVKTRSKKMKVEELQVDDSDKEPTTEVDKP